MGSEICFRKIRAVVAEDVPEMQEYIVETLHSDGLVQVVGTAEDGIVAVMMAKSLAPDLVILDINMPKMTGLEAANLIKQESPKTRVLIICADDDPELLTCVRGCGADGFLAKSRLATECKNRIKRIFMDRRPKR